MKQKSLLMLKSLVTRYNTQDSEEVLSFLSEDQAQKLKEASVNPSFDIKTLLSEKESLKNVHYSWIYEAFSHFPKNNVAFFLSCVTNEQKKGLELLLAGEKAAPLSPWASLFLSHVLKKKIQNKEVLPFEFLPLSPFLDLFKLSKAKIVKIIEILGLIDLSLDLRYILDKNQLGKIQKILTEEELQFVEYFSKQPIKWVPPRLGLEKWDGEKKTLFKLLHGRGLSRFAKALRNEDESFKWHLSHYLDTGRGKVLMRLWLEKQDLALTPYFQNELLMLLKRFVR